MNSFLERLLIASLVIYLTEVILNTFVQNPQIHKALFVIVLVLSLLFVIFGYAGL